MFCLQSKYPKVQSEKETQKENGETDCEVNGERCQMALNIIWTKVTFRDMTGITIKQKP